MQYLPYNVSTAKSHRKAITEKALGPDEIPNLILKKSFTTLSQHLLALAQASLESGHFPTIFKESMTIVLRKPNKSDYTKVKAYRPVALENTLGKVMESVVTEIICYLTETYELLPAYHFGGRPG